jgi:hypothetical protein
MVAVDNHNTLCEHRHGLFAWMTYHLYKNQDYEGLSIMYSWPGSGQLKWHFGSELMKRIAKPLCDYGIISTWSLAEALKELN